MLNETLENAAQKNTFTRDQRLALEWEARMCARAYHRINERTNVAALDEKYRELLREEAAKNPKSFFETLMKNYAKALSGTNKAQIKFEDEYVSQKVQAYRQKHAARLQGQGR